MQREFTHPARVVEITHGPREEPSDDTEEPARDAPVVLDDDGTPVAEAPERQTA
ncbi:MAG: hypothetical protein QOC78_3816 [Solirubrobacteraceae bacterium]|jgi:hypothetical protein|nr:hypothetical protein [Solirubrobacteraceae bacterium]